MKINKKGFAISTILYGLIFLSVAIFYMIIKIVDAETTANDNFVDGVRTELNEKE